MKNFSLLLILTLSVSSLCSQDPIKKIFTTPFIVHSVTYNGSPDPNECWESVAWGIIIEDENNRELFFGLYYEDLMELEKKIGDAVVEVEVVFGEGAYDGNNESGSVSKVTLRGQVIFGR